MDEQLFNKRHLGKMVSEYRSPGTKNTPGLSRGLLMGLLLETDQAFFGSLSLLVYL